MKENKNKDIDFQENPQSVEGESTAQPGAWKRLMAKKWAYPAIYLAALAIILTLMWVYQDSGKKAVSDVSATLSGKTGQTAVDSAKPDALPANANAEALQWPVKDRSEVDIALGYYDKNATADEKLNATISTSDNTFEPSTGIVLQREDNASFDVLAAGSGVVTDVEKSAPLAGNYVEITHNNGLITVYQSLGDLKVEKGDKVKKGAVIATAGRNELEKDYGVHLHFEVRSASDNTTVNPKEVLPQQ
ncbi:M23 family metallopeptidase [Gorillibacterium massiliense]|uniref:M23 family metallopeptidase n=1 Tax=Gorillibacterium massiliense TaxID=1280390 RepID=UPI0004B44B1D|nr:M23 family metallopeptidase [Gorillibacterium massiliense]